MIAEKYRDMTEDGCWNEAHRESGLVVAFCCMAACVLFVAVILGLICGVIEA